MMINKVTKRRKFDDDADWLPQKDRLFVLKQPLPPESSGPAPPASPLPLATPLPPESKDRSQQNLNKKQGPLTRRD